MPTPCRGVRRRVQDGSAVAWLGFHAALEQRLGDLCLEAAALAAGAACAVRVDDDVADLTGRERRACVEAPVEHEVGTDTLVDTYADQVGRRLLAERQLGERTALASLTARTGRSNSPTGLRRAGGGSSRGGRP